MDSIRDKLMKELERQGLPREDSADIADNLAPGVEANINNLLKGNDMDVELMGVTIASVQARIHALFPAVGINDQGVYARASTVISANPSWTEDQVVEEVSKSFKPKSDGGYTVTKSAAAAAKSTRAGIIIGAAVLVLALISFRQAKKAQA